MLKTHIGRDKFLMNTFQKVINSVHTQIWVNAVCIFISFQVQFTSFVKEG